MSLHKYLIIVGLSFVFITCETNNKTSLAINLNTDTIVLNDTLNLSINNPKQLNVQSVKYTLDEKLIEPQTILNAVTLGKKQLKAEVIYDGETVVLEKQIIIYNNKRPDVYTYEIINTFPHDITSYTQGLEFYNGELYETTGQKKASKLRKVEFETGKVLKNIDLDDVYFGEGLSILNEKIYQLTWQSDIGFVYDVNTFEKTSSFTYDQSKEGWGLCNDDKTLYKSDGTEKIWTLNPETLTETSHIQAYREKGKKGIQGLNELEWIDGKIYANIYQYNGVVIINPKNGAVDGVIDFKPLKELVTQHDKLDVLNGIAYNPERETIFVTGKNWDKLFEVKIKKKQ